MIVFPNCKINLGLHILRKRSDGFHDLQTVFYPFPLTDALELIPDPSPTAQDFTLTTSGREINTPTKDNICYKAFALLQKDFPEQVKPVRLHLHKVIPSGAGLGGGSADGSFTLLLLNRRFQLGLDDAALAAYALQLGSDCPFFITNAPAIAEGRGEKLEPLTLDLSHYHIVLVHPGISVPTGWAFSQIQPQDDRPDLRSVITADPVSWRHSLVNDFEAPVMKAYPEIESVKEQLYEQGAVYASMSGSGSSVYGLFPKTASLNLHFPQHYTVLNPFALPA